MSVIGKRKWAIAAGHIPLGSSGDEPAMTSRDELRLLNASESGAKVTISVIYSDREPVGPYEIEVAARRLRSVRVNDLIDPLPVPLDTPYSLVIESTTPIVVQFTRVDSSAAAATTCGTTAHS